MWVAAEQSVYIYELLMDERTGNMQPRGISHMHQAPKILQNNSDDTVISKMGFRRTLSKPSIKPMTGLTEVKVLRQDKKILWKAPVANIMI